MWRAWAADGGWEKAMRRVSCVGLLLVVAGGGASIVQTAPVVFWADESPLSKGVYSGDTACTYCVDDDGEVASTPETVAWTVVVDGWGLVVEANGVVKVGGKRTKVLLALRRQTDITLYEVTMDSVIVGRAAEWETLWGVVQVGGKETYRPPGGGLQ